jgi:hypothetical protein
MSPARTVHIARRSIEHNEIIGAERFATELHTDHAAAFSSNQHIELSIKGKAISIGKLAQCVSRSGRDLDGGHIRHTQQYTCPQQTYGARLVP